MITALVLTLSSSLAAPPPPAAARLRVLVRFDQASNRAGIRMADVMDEVFEIWRPYVDLSAAGSVPPEAAYDDALDVNVADRASSRGEEGLGWTVFDGPGRPRNAVTVSLTAITELVKVGSWGGRAVSDLPLGLQKRFMTHAMSRVIAHEMGHYLLRSTSHAQSGLMRARLAVADFMAPGLSSFRLRPVEIELLAHRAWAARLAAAVAPRERHTG